METLVAALINSSVSANKNHLGLFNNGGSRPLEVWRVEVVSHLPAAVTGTGTSFVLSRTSTVGTGTPVVIRRTNNRGKTLPASLSALHTYTVQPTVTANSELASLALSTEEAGNAVCASKEALYAADPSRSIDPITLYPGEGLVVQQSPLASAGAVNVFIYFRIKPPAKEVRNGV